MNIQIFGTAKCVDTRKAERYFKERRIKYQFVDILKFGMSRGELNSVKNAVGLEASKTTIASANAADYVVGIPTLILMFAAPALYKNSKRLKKLWPYEMSEPELLGDGDHEELMASKEWSIQEIAWLLAIGFGTVWAATGISSVVFGEGFRSAGRILLITTFSIILAQVPAIRKLRANALKIPSIL